MKKLTRTSSRETASMVAVAIGGLVGGVIEWALLISAVSYLMSY
jgi:hypothetical protein